MGSEKIMRECFRAKGRQLFVHREDAENLVLVFELETGELINTTTLKPFEPGDTYRLAESHPDPASYSWMGKYSDKWGDECVAFFGSVESADLYAADHQIGHWILQRVRLMAVDFGSTGPRV